MNSFTLYLKKIQFPRQVAEIKSMHSSSSGVSTSTSTSTAQTDIVAVHTPVGEMPPPSLFRRPCTLSLSETLRTTVINHVGDGS